MTATIRIGFHANNPTLLALSGSGILEGRLQSLDVEVEWIRIANGARTVDYIGAGLIDIGGTGATPPIDAQARGIDLVYIATSQSRPVGGILVAQDSPIRAPSELRGKRIALAIGAWHQHLLATALERAGIAWSEIVPLDIPEPLAAKALLAGTIDAWATGEDNPRVVEGLRFIARTEDLVGNQSVFFARRDFAEQNPVLLDIVVQALDASDRWIESHPGQAARQLAVAARSHLDAAAWESHIRSRPWGLIAVDDVFLDQQQHAADLFHRFGLLPRRVDVREATLLRPLPAERPPGDRTAGSPATSRTNGATAAEQTATLSIQP
jgi:sulfonate transport system substrate-binding protein